MIPALRVAIVGYGIAGISTAIQLRGQGHDITHFERNHPPVARGAGMILHPPALRHLQKLGLLEAASACGAPIRRVCAQTLQGQALMDLDYSALFAGQHGLGIQRGTLHRLLSAVDAAPVSSPRHMTSIDPQQGYLFDEARARYGPYDLIVVADGAHSTLRGRLPIAARRNQHAKSAALVGLLDDPDRLMANDLAQYFEGNRHLSVWPVGSESPGTPPRCAFAMNVSLSEAPAFRDSGNWRSQLVRFCPTIGKLLHASVDNADFHIYAYRDVELDTCSVGRAVLIGDAAHSMSPQLGVGAQLALEDAHMLASTLAGKPDVCAALTDYARLRPPMLRRYHNASRWLTTVFQTESPLLSLVRDQLLARTLGGPLVQKFARELFS